MIKCVKYPNWCCADVLPLPNDKLWNLAIHDVVYDLQYIYKDKLIFGYCNFLRKARQIPQDWCRLFRLINTLNLHWCDQPLYFNNKTIFTDTNFDTYIYI